jgi:thioredoxin reductase
MSPSSPVVVVIGAGPVGLEAAALLSQAGFATTVFERGRCAENVRRWGHVRLFSPFERNASPWGRSLISQSPSSATAGHLPHSQAILTGAEFIEAYLEPLRHALAARVRFVDETEVVSVGRRRFLKGEALGQPERAADGFRLLVRDARGERTEFADVVLDCSGTYGRHRWLGAGGIPCPGERECLSHDDYLLPDVLQRDRAQFAGRTSLVVGAGHSAATTIVAIAELAGQQPGTRAVWVTRRDAVSPLIELDHDALPERAALTRAANRIALAPSGPVEWLAGWSVDRIHRNDKARHHFTVALVRANSEQTRQVAVDHIVANVGYRPERTMTEELQIHECYASQGPIKLAAALLGETSTDCLQQSAKGIDVLRNPEPRFFILGAKSYGRDARYLMQIGIAQVAEVARSLCAEFRLPPPKP